MKKSCKTLLILSIVFSIIIMIMCFIPVEFPGEINSTTEAVLEDVKKMDGAPGSGEYLILIMPFALLADFGIVVYLLIFNILIPGVTLSSILFLQVVARLFLMGKERKWKNIVCFIITIFALMVIYSLVFSLRLCMGVTKFISIFLAIIWIITYIVQIVKMVGKIEVKEKENVIVKNDNQETTQN